MARGEQTLSGAKIALLMAAAAVLTQLANYIAKRVEHEPYSAPRSMGVPAAPADPIPVPPKEPPSTDDGVVEARLVRKHANEALIDHNDRIVQLEDQVCKLKAELRLTLARLVELQGGKRGGTARDLFEQRTTEWTVCPPPENGRKQQLGSLRDSADSVLRR